jgi:hypothetical protein
MLLPVARRSMAAAFDERITEKNPLPIRSGLSSPVAFEI